ncbi:hypothetical protein Q3G72_003091 [Acer saccharum]|nr:hypothetical protein Q3G72_003091 [Acer saccharum]
MPGCNEKKGKRQEEDAQSTQISKVDRMRPKEEAERFNRYASMKSNVRAQKRLCPPVALQVSSLNRRWLGVDPLILSCFDEDYLDSMQEEAEYLVKFFVIRHSMANLLLIRSTSE